MSSKPYEIILPGPDEKGKPKLLLKTGISGKEWKEGIKQFNEKYEQYEKNKK